jgi:hypothetical protein
MYRRHESNDDRLLGSGLVLSVENAETATGTMADQAASHASADLPRS